MEVKGKYLHSTQALWTHVSGISTRWLSQRVGHWCLYGVRSPQIFLMESLLSVYSGILALAEALGRVGWVQLQIMNGGVRMALMTSS